MTDIIVRGVEAGDDIKIIEAAILAQWPEATEEDRRAAYRVAAVEIKRLAETRRAEAAQMQREADQSYAVIEELCEISLETGIPLHPTTPMWDFVREAAATGNKRAAVLLEQFPG
jgi:hypothetical protein